MPNLSPLETLFDNARGSPVPLGETLARLYGTLKFPVGGHRPYVISNFVSSIDGVVTLGIPGKSGGDAISGKNRHDAALMGILRSISDAVIVGAKNLDASPKHIWTPERVFRDYGEEYRELRRRLKKEHAPLNVIVTSRGSIDVDFPIFQSGLVNTLIVTTARGAAKLRKRKLPEWVRVDYAGKGRFLGAKEILKAVMRARPSCRTILVEGGPQLMGTFLGDRMLDELFLTVSPQVAGRGLTPERLGLVAAKILAPDDAVWGKLTSVRRVDNHLFLRYTFPR